MSGRRAMVDLVIVEHDAGGRAPWPAPLEAAGLAASQLGADARIACVAIDAEGCRVAPLLQVDPVAECAPAIAETLVAVRDEVEPGYAYTLRCAVDVLGPYPNRARDRRAAIIFFSDGRPGADLPDTPDVYRLLEERGWPVFTIGVGTAASDPAASSVLATMARATGGGFFPAATADELLAACAAVIAELVRERPANDGMSAGGGGADLGGE